MSEKEMRFGFGRNWAKFVESHFNEETLASSVAGLLRFLQLENLSNRTFLTLAVGVGCLPSPLIKPGRKKFSVLITILTPSKRPPGSNIGSTTPKAGR